MSMTWSNVSNLQWSDSSETNINMDVLFNHIGETVRFTSSASDGVLHSRQLHSLALNGDFGAIAVAPNPLNTDSSG